MIYTLCVMICNSYGIDDIHALRDEKTKGLIFQSLFGAPAENRTPDTLIKSQVLYQLSYRGMYISSPNIVT